MKEYFFFLEVGFILKDLNYIEVVDNFRMEFDKFLVDVIVIFDGIVSNDILEFGEVIILFIIVVE